MIILSNCLGPARCVSMFPKSRPLGLASSTLFGSMASKAPISFYPIFMKGCQILFSHIASALERLRLAAWRLALDACRLSLAASHSQYGLTVPITWLREAGAAGPASRSNLLLYFDVLLNDRGHLIRGGKYFSIFRCYLHFVQHVIS